MILLGVLFNHDQNSSATSALNVRLNGRTAARLPEWEEGDTFQSSVAAYATDAVDPAKLRIFARFEAPEFAGQTIVVETRSPGIGELPGYLEDQLNALVFINFPLYLLLRNNLQLFYTLIEQSTSGVLGTLQRRRVTFDDQGQSGWVPFRPIGTRLKEAGVGRHIISWTWHYRRPGRSWQIMTLTQHKIYSVLKVPFQPWVQQPFVASNTQLPWIEALEVATQWAAGAQTRASASARVTQSIYDLGTSEFEYGCPVGARTVYSDPAFNLTQFLQRLAGDYGLGPYINCSDCATFTSTFANLLGDTLWQSQMRDFTRAFPVNPIRAIGTTAVIPPCGIGLFNYHEVAWTGDATEDDLVYDPCLEVNTNPFLLPEQMVLPTGMRFGAVSDGQYRDFLAAPFGRELCRPQPIMKQRRPVF